uniref:uncharacterized protein LOC120333734 n=1 Tax=Styela clava TaxID=7725 RepID=UPI00193A1450|nr:uncharacterized protein LOC120333734 [Styela clava]
MVTMPMALRGEKSHDRLGKIEILDRMTSYRKIEPQNVGDMGCIRYTTILIRDLYHLLKQTRRIHRNPEFTRDCIAGRDLSLSRSIVSSANSFAKKEEQWI